MKKVLLVLVPVILIGGLVAGGIYYHQAQQAKKQTTNTVATKQEVKSETTNFQTYTDTQYGFSFQYPATTAVEKSQNGTLIISDAATSYGMYNIYAEKASKSLADYTNDAINNWVGGTRPDGTPVARSEINVADITVGGQPAKKIWIDNIGDRGNELVFVIYTNSNEDNILLNIKGDTHYTDFNTTFLNSFDFTVSVNNQDETANWQTYTNARYAYSIKYPSNWFAHTNNAESDYTGRGADAELLIIGGDAGWTNYERDNFTPADEPSDLVGVSLEIYKTSSTDDIFMLDERESLSKNKEASNIVVSDIQGRPFVKFITTNSEQVVSEPPGTKHLFAIVKIDGGYMKFGYTPLTPSRLKTDDGKIFDLMISSLKFAK